jgi:hypothetical protein
VKSGRRKQGEALSGYNRVKRGRRARERVGPGGEGERGGEEGSRRRGSGVKRGRSECGIVRKAIGVPKGKRVCVICQTLGFLSIDSIGTLKAVRFIFF